MGKIGYLAMLKTGDISTVGLEMPQQKIIDSFNHISNARKDDPAKILNVEAKVAHSVFYDVTPTDTFIPKKAEPKPVAIQESLSGAVPTMIDKPKRPADKTTFAQKLRKTHFRWLTKPCRAGLVTCRVISRCFIYKSPPHGLCTAQSKTYRYWTPKNPVNL